MLQKNLATKIHKIIQLEHFVNNWGAQKKAAFKTQVLKAASL